MNLLPVKIFTAASLAVSGAALLCAAPMVDRYGQYLREEWPGKVTCDAQLRADAKREKLGSGRFDPAKFDRFGGLLAEGKFKATGRFRLEKINGRWWFITPEGHKFYLIAADAVDHRESGYSTPLFERNGQPRDVFAELPSKKEFPTAYFGNRVNFISANLQRKYGPGADKTGLVNARKRLLDWGFNSSGKWGWGTEIGIPYFEDYNFRTVKRIGRIIDPYEPDFAAKAEPEVAKHVAMRKNDPNMIAYATENENGWNLENVKTITAAAPSVAAKRALVDYLIRQLGEARAAKLFGAADKSGMLANRKGIDLPEKLAYGFIAEASARYHKIVGALYKKYDPEHLWFAASHCHGNSVDWVLASAPYVDAFMLNEYDVDSAWIMGNVNRYLKTGKPFIVTEFSFTIDRRGMPARWECNNVASDRDRGLAYRHYTERLAAVPLCMGFCYFIYYDQPVTMRNLPDGENCNFGLVTQQDQPYTAMLEEVKKSNARFVAVHKGEVKPFQVANTTKLINTRFRDSFHFLSDPQVRRYTMIEVRDTASWHDSCRMKINESAIPGPGNYCFGTVKLARETPKNFRLNVFFWDGSGKKVTDYPLVEVSQDNRKFTPVAVTVTAGEAAPRNWREYEIRNSGPLPAGTRFVRFGTKVPQPGYSWLLLLKSLTWEK